MKCGSSRRVLARTLSAAASLLVGGVLPAYGNQPGAVFRTALTLPLGAQPTALQETTHPRFGTVLAVGTTRGILVTALSGGRLRVLQVIDDVAPIRTLATGDITGDGYPDLAVSSGRNGRLRLYRGTSRGYFTNPRPVPGIEQVRRILSHSGVLYAAARGGIFRIGEPAGAQRVERVSRIEVVDWVIADIDGNGSADLIVATGSRDLVVLLGVSPPGRPIERRLSSLEDTRRVAVIDLDGDGSEDLAVAGNDRIAAHFRTSAGWFGPPQILVNRAPSTGLAVADLDRDGRQDLLLLAEREGVLQVLGAIRRDRDATIAGAYRAGRSATAALAGDYDDDGEPDVAVLDPSNDRLVMLRGLGGGRLQGPVAVRTGDPDVSALVALDIDGDGLTDLVSASRGASAVRVHRSDGKGRFVSSPPIPVDSDPRALAVADFDADGFPDIAVASFGRDTVTVLRNDGTGRLLPERSLSVPAAPAALVAEALDGDAFPDLAVASAVARRLTIFYGGPGGSFSRRTELALPLSPHFLVFGDRDGDGYPDLVAGNRVERTVAVAHGGPQGITGVAASPLGERVRPSVGSDFDGDGVLDLAVPDPLGLGVSLLRGRPEGGFDSPVVLDLGHRPGAVAPGDFNGDGRPDLAVADESTGVVTVVLNAPAAGPSRAP